MKAKPTVYHSVRFRSKLEARWAAFFDAIYAEWEYEPSISATAGEYLPDFKLSGLSLPVLIEIKPLIPGSSDLETFVRNDSARDALYSRAAEALGGHLFLVFGEPGQWQNGRLVGPGHQATHYWPSGKWDTAIPYLWAECDECGRVYPWPAGQPMCCPRWTAGSGLKLALEKVRDHSFDSGAVLEWSLSTPILPSQSEISDLDLALRDGRRLLREVYETGDSSRLEEIEARIDQLGRRKAQLVREMVGAL